MSGWWRTARPNQSDRLALVSQDAPASAYWPVRLTQIIGGRTWSLSVVRFTTPRPVATLDRIFGKDSR